MREIRCVEFDLCTLKVGIDRREETKMASRVDTLRVGDE